MNAVKRLANQFVLLAVLQEKCGTRPTAAPHLRVVAEPFPSQRAWLSEATDLYLSLWPGGSNPEWGPEKAIRSVLHKGWVIETWHGRSLVPALTATGAEALAATDLSTVRPMYVYDIDVQLRQPGAADLGAPLADKQPNTEES